MSGDVPLRLRPAEAADAERLLEWRNEPSTRAASLSRQEIELPGHRAWLARRLADPACALFIVEYDGRPVGQLRLDRSGASAEVSIGLAPDARGRGLGRRSLLAVEPEARRWPAVGELVAQVRTENTASLRLFTAAGYAEAARAEGVVRLVKPIRL